MPGSFDPSPESHNVVLIDSRVIREAETFVAGCEACSPNYSQIPFDSVLDGLTGNDPAITDYILSEPAMSGVPAPDSGEHARAAGAVGNGHQYITRYRDVLESKSSAAETSRRGL